MEIPDIHKILQCLPHRYPFLLVDKVIDIELEKYIVAIKNVTVNEPFFAGHFPQKPVMPGVLIIEALAQTAGILSYLSYKDIAVPNVIQFLAGIDKARFKKVVEPGDQLSMRVELTKIRRDVIKVSGEVTVDGQLACSAELMSAKGEI